MHEKRIRWGILGAARIARQWLCPAIHMSRAGHIEAVASRTAQKAEDLAGPYGDVRIFTDYDAMLGDANIDAIYIPLPNADHFEWTMKCLDAGKHVLCEKPIALKRQEIDTLIEQRDRTGLLAAEAFMVVHHPQWERVRELVNGGRIGKLRHVQGAFSFFNDDPANIRNRPQDGGGALRDIGVYPSVVTRFVTGEEPERIQSRIEWENGIDATARVWADFASFSMDFYVSMRMADRQLMVFHGENASLSVHTPFNAKLYGDDVIEIRDNEGDRQIERFPLVDQYTVQIDRFNQSALEATDFPCPLEFSRGNQRMIDMIYDSAIE
jgi:predicted dehydrogenase